MVTKRTRAASSKSSPKPIAPPSKRSKRSIPNNEVTYTDEEADMEQSEIEEEEEDLLVEDEVKSTTSNEEVEVEEADSSKKKLKRAVPVPRRDEEDEEAVLDGEPVPAEEARRKWPDRYDYNKKDNAGSKSSTPDEDLEHIQALRHYTKAKEGCLIYNLGDDAYVYAGKGEENYICKIVEMFKGTDGLPYFRAQWYYRAKDTAIKESSNLIDNRRVFFSEIKNNNHLSSLVRKLNIVRLPLEMESLEREKATSDCDYYCDMMYLCSFESFVKLPCESGGITNCMGATSDSDSTVSTELVAGAMSGNKADLEIAAEDEVSKETEMTLLDLYSGCGGMSTGLCFGANSSGVNLVTKWAVDINSYACESLRFNHPETHVRNESAENFLSLLKEWEILCGSYLENEDLQQIVDSSEAEEDDHHDNSDDANKEDDVEVYEVEKILDICYGDPNEIKKPGLYLKVKWKNYGEEYDTWEPIDGLGDCQDRVKEFVIDGHRKKLLPLPGDIDVICGGPPCQGISGFNRFRETENPFKDEKNKQLLVYMNIIEYLNPKFILMENVVDLLKFSGGILGRYALGRLVGMNYQARLGIMAAGSYGLPQVRMRVFMWGACPTENLPQYPLPTHEYISRGVSPTEFQSSIVRHNEGMNADLKQALLLEDAISDLPPVENDEEKDEMPYDNEPVTEFQRFIRLAKQELLRNPVSLSGDLVSILFDHRPLKLKHDDYLRVCEIPKIKGANFRNLKGVKVGADKKVEWDPDVERVYLPSGKPLVPDYAMSFVKGKSTKPFRRLWWDETVNTVVTRAEPHNQAVLHPLQDRVLSVRENARLQGFPDYYKLFGPIKERYIQVGNAVAVSVSRALGYALGSATQGTWSDDPLLTLPRNFPTHS